MYTGTTYSLGQQQWSFCTKEASPLRRSLFKTAPSRYICCSGGPDFKVDFLKNVHCNDFLTFTQDSPSIGDAENPCFVWTHPNRPFRANRGPVTVIVGLGYTLIHRYSVTKCIQHATNAKQIHTLQESIEECGRHWRYTLTHRTPVPERSTTGI